MFHKHMSISWYIFNHSYVILVMLGLCIVRNICTMYVQVDEETYHSQMAKVELLMFYMCLLCIYR